MASTARAGGKHYLLAYASFSQATLFGGSLIIKVTIQQRAGDEE